MSNQLRMRHCRCCGAEVGHDGWLDVCDNPVCVRKGTIEHALKNHLRIFRVETLYCVAVSDFERDDCLVRTEAAYFNTEAEAKEFVARVRAGMPKNELAALLKAHGLPPERITIEELRRRANEQGCDD